MRCSIRSIFLGVYAPEGGTNLTGKAKLDPWLIGTGVTYRF